MWPWLWRFTFFNDGLPRDIKRRRRCATLGHEKVLTCRGIGARAITSTPRTGVERSSFCYDLPSFGFSAWFPFNNNDNVVEIFSTGRPRNKRICAEFKTGQSRVRMQREVGTRQAIKRGTGCWVFLTNGAFSLDQGFIHNRFSGYCQLTSGDVITTFIRCSTLGDRVPREGS